MYRKIPFFFLILNFITPVYAASYSDLERKIEAQGNLLINNQQLISDIQSELNLLRGELEEISHKLDQTIERQKTIIQESLKNSSSKTPKAEPADLTNWVPTGNDKTDYNFILKFISSNKKINETTNALQQFLQTYPKSSYTANVNYWLGQLYFKQNKKNDASFYYATVVKNYPSSQKAAESLYKIGVILLEQGEKSKSKAIFQQVATKYPTDAKVITLVEKKLDELNETYK